MARVTHRDFSLGLWLAGSRDGIPRNALRQARSIAQLRERHIKSRWGGKRLSMLPGNADSIFHFAQQDFVQVGQELGVLVGNINTTTYGPLALPPLGGARLRTARMTPTTNTLLSAFPVTTDHVFLAGGNVGVNGNVALNAFGAQKLDAVRRASKWGIDAPKGFLQALLDETDYSQHISTFDGFEGFPWLPVTDFPGAGTVTFSPNRQQGSASLQLRVGSGITFTIVRRLRFNALIGPGNIQSSDQDWIQFWVWVDDPSTVTYLEILFDTTSDIDAPLDPAGLYTTNGIQDGYAFKLLPSDTSAADIAQISGLADHIRFNQTAGFIDTFGVVYPASQLAPTSGSAGDPINPNSLSEQKRLKYGLTLDEHISASTAKQIVHDLGTTRFPATSKSWYRIRIPKSSFTKFGRAFTDNLWGQIRRVFFSLHTEENTQTDVFTTLRLDDLALHLGTGMMGDYTYAYTYKNSLTGSRSNPSSLGKVKKVKRQAVIMVGITLPTDPQVDTIEIWRTIGGGAVLFKAEDIPQDHFVSLPTAGHTDLVADFLGMQDEGLRTAFTNPDGSPRLTQFLQTEQLPFDNVPPPDSVKDVAGPHLGRLFFLDAARGARGRCYFTPPGRAEATDGFLNCTSDDDALQRVVLWNGQVYVFSFAKLFEIAGQDILISTEIYGIPGTQLPGSVVPTPGGIAYVAKDGLRRFTGSSSELIAPEAILALFLGESVTLGATGGTIDAFDRPRDITAEYYEGEYLISNGKTTLAVHLDTKVWREVGVAASAIYAHPGKRELFLSAHSTIYAWEEIDEITDGGFAIPFIVEIPGTVLENQSGATKFVQRVYIDCNTRGQTLRAIVRTILHGDIDIGTISTFGRELLEIALFVVGDVLSIELSGQLTDRVEIFGVAYDYHPTVGSDGADT